MQTQEGEVYFCDNCPLKLKTDQGGPVKLDKFDYLRQRDTVENSVAAYFSISEDEATGVHIDVSSDSEMPEEVDEKALGNLVYTQIRDCVANVSVKNTVECPAFNETMFRQLAPQFAEQGTESVNE